jgi:RNA polymerase sigma factor (sigma-70 family)
VSGTVQAITDEPADAVLTQAVRNGEVAAYGVLYTRHLGAARRVAASYGVGDAERDDLIAEGFMRVLRILRTGGGPDEDFRPYLLTTIRNTVISWRRRDSSVSTVAEVPDIVPPSGGEDPMATRMHATLAADAFASLPERWRTVLWRTEIEGESPAQIAKLLGMTPNGVAALAYRAREGLRQAYLDQYVPEREHRSCRTVVGQLAKWVRHGVTEPKARRITAHLDRCADCREVAADLRRLNQELPATVAPLLLAGPIVLAEWATAASGGLLAATGAGLSAASWLTIAKTVVAGAAMITTATIGATASAPPSPPVLAEDGSTMTWPASQSGPPGSRPDGQSPAPGVYAPAGATVDPATPASPSGVGVPATQPSVPQAPPTTPATTPPTTGTDAGQARQDAKQEKKDAKQAAKDEKQAKKDEKAAKKEERKEEKAAAKSKAPEEPE